MAKKKKKNVKKKPAPSRPRKQPSNVPAIVFFSISAVVIVAVLVLMMVNSTPETETASSYEFTYEGLPAIGDDNAPIKMVEFGDYKCPACKEFAETVFAPLKEDFIDTGKVQFHFINYPVMAEDSFTAAEVGEAVYDQDEEAFWTYYQTVYEKQQEESKRWATMHFLTTLVEEHLPEIDLDQLESDMDDHVYASAVEEDIAIADQAGVSATPTIFINGKEFQNWSDYEAMKDELNRLLEKAKNE